MPTLKITGVPPLDGEYELPSILTLSHRENHIIKQETGVRAGEIREALAAGDQDIVVALALIALRRAGKGEVVEFRDLLWDAVGGITLDFTEEEKVAEARDESPPASEPEETMKPDAKNGPSGSDTASDSGIPANDRSHIGTPV